MPTPRPEQYAALPEELKKISVALTELNKVMSGANNFNEQKIWGPDGTAELNVVTYVKDLAIDTNLKKEIDALLKGVTSGSAVKSAMDTVFNGMTDIVTKIQNKVQELSDEGGARLTALDHLASPHSTAANYDYKPYDPGDDNKYGFVPAIAGVIEAVGDTDLNVESIMGPVRQLAALAAAGEATVTLVAYATGTVDRLNKALQVA